MTDTYITRPLEKSASTQDRTATLHALAFTALRLSTAQLESFGAQLDQALFIQIAKSTDAGEEARYRHIWQLLKKHRPTFQRFVSDALQQTLLQAVQSIRRPGVESREFDVPEASERGLSDLARQAMIDGLSEALDAAGADALGALSVRVAHLAHSDDMGPEQNPFRAATFLKAVADAWHKFDPEDDSLSLVLPLMRPETFLPLGLLWQEMNRDLAARGVLPGAEEIWRRQKADAAHFSVRPLPERLRRWLVAGGKVSSERGEELFARLFEQLDADEAIPATLRQQLAQLKEPLHQFVQSDVTFFFDGMHPARQLLNAFLDCGMGLAGDNGEDPAREVLENALAQLLQEGSAQESHLEDIAALIGEFTAQQLRADRLALNDAIAKAGAQEKGVHARQQAEDDIHPRLEGGEVDDFLETFLQGQWVRVLADAHESSPLELPTALKAMDDLIWSIKPKGTPEERLQLVGRLPTLLAEIHSGLDRVGWNGAEREAFFAELAARHAVSMRGPVELTARDELEHRMDAMQKATEHELSRIARDGMKAELAHIMRQARVLVPGGWVEFVRNDGGRLNCKLIWVSPAARCFVFAGRNGRLVFTLEDKELAQALRMGRATIIPGDMLVTRALGAALTASGIH